MKLLIDEMLHNLVSWLRIFGIDTAFITPENDDELIEYASREKRWLVTRDRVLSVRCNKYNVKSLFLEEENSDRQLAALVCQLNLRLNFPEGIRCSACNIPLEQVDKKEIIDLIPEQVSALDIKFRRCRSCKKVYWEGSHWQNITKKYQRLIKELRACYKIRFRSENFDALS